MVATTCQHFNSWSLLWLWRNFKLLAFTRAQSCRQLVSGVTSWFGNVTCLCKPNLFDIGFRSKWSKSFKIEIANNVTQQLSNLKQHQTTWNSKQAQTSLCNKYINCMRVMFYEFLWCYVYVWNHWLRKVDVASPVESTWTSLPSAKSSPEVR